MKKIAIIGVGITGLIIANLLKEKAEIVMFEKSRGVGGRLATRYADAWEFDHGTPFFTATKPEFEEFLKPLFDSGIVSKWNAIMHNIGDETYYVGSPKMNSIGKHLAKGLNIHLETKITELSKTNGKWQLSDDKLQTHNGFDCIITATPPQQAFDILPQECFYKMHLKNIEMLPAFSVILGFDCNAMQGQNWDISHPKSAIIKTIVANHNKPSRTNKPSFVVHTGDDWSQQNVNINKDDIPQIIISELEKIFGEKINPSITQVHRWLYAQAKIQNNTQPFFADANQSLISCGDWCIGNNVESAFQSSIAVCEYIKHF